MAPASARALIVFASVLVVFAVAIPSPSGAIFLSAVASVCTLVAAVFGPRGTRAGALAVLVVAGACVVSFYPGYRRDQERYREHGRQAPTAPATPGR